MPPFNRRPHFPDRQGDIELGYGNSFYSSAYDGNFGVSLSGSYAFTDKYFVSANYLGWSVDVESDTVPSSSFLDFENWGSRANIFEVGIGRYWVHPEDRNWRFEITSGYGMGFIDNTREDFAITNARYQNIFLQPAVGYKSKYLWLIGSLKLNYVNFRSLAWSFPDAASNQVLTAFYDGNRQNLSLDPGVNLSLHFDPIVLSAKYTWSTFNSEVLGESDLPLVMSRNFTMTISARFNSMKRK